MFVSDTRSFKRSAVACLAMPLVACLATEQPVDPSRSIPDPPKLIEIGAPEIQVLPFDVRMSKLSHVLGLELSDPLFDELHQQRFQLGDHEYARALRPDRRWSGRKMGIWVKGLLPICHSNHFHERYPAVATMPDELIQSAYGRPADEMDRTLLSEAVDDSVVCLALLSSLEFVAQ